MARERRHASDWPAVYMPVSGMPVSTMLGVELMRVQDSRAATRIAAGEGTGELPRAAHCLVIACGALAREIGAVLEANALWHVDLTCLPAGLHNRPEKIPDAVRAAISAARGSYARIFVAYADCGTGGLLDRVLEEEGVARLTGPHCYAVFTGVAEFARQQDSDMRSFFLTDFLARQFDTLVIEGLGIDRHPELRDSYFGHYERVVYLAQTDDPTLRAKAAAAADRLGLAFEVRPVGFGDLAGAIRAFASGASPPAG